MFGDISPKLVVFNSKLYAVWGERNANNASQVRVAVYNGNDEAPSWAYVDGNTDEGINKDTTRVVQNPALIVLNSQLVAMWYEGVGDLDINQMRVATYNGDDSSPTWSFVDGGGTYGINKAVSSNAIQPTMAILNGQLYAAWKEVISLFDGSPGQIRVVTATKH
jgi:hypothetical protein